MSGGKTCGCFASAAENDEPDSTSACTATSAACSVLSSVCSIRIDERAHAAADRR